MVNNLTITDISIFPIKNPKEGSNLLAYAKLILNDAFAVSSIRIVNGKNGPFLGFPQNWNKDTNDSFDICFPISIELRDYATVEVLQAFKDKLEIAQQYQ